MKAPNRLLVLAALLPLCLVWQSSPFALLPVFGWRLDPLLVLSFSVGLLMGPYYGAAFGLIAGGTQDLVLGAGLIYGATKCLAGLCAGLLQPRIYKLDFVSIFLVGFIGTGIESLFVALTLFFHGRTAIWDHFGALALPLGLAHALLLILAVPLLDHLPGFESREKAR